MENFSIFALESLWFAQFHQLAVEKKQSRLGVTVVVTW